MVDKEEMTMNNYNRGRKNADGIKHQAEPNKYFAKSDSKPTAKMARMQIG